MSNHVFDELATNGAEDFSDDGFFRTGDLGNVDDDGYVHIVGQAKDLVISGGFNVYPQEVESLPHRDLGEAVAAVVVKACGADVDEAAISHALAGRLAKYKRPRRILYVDELPRNTMGKVQTNVLRDVLKDVFAD